MAPALDQRDSEPGVTAEAFRRPELVATGCAAAGSTNPAGTTVGAVAAGTSAAGAGSGAGEGEGEGSGAGEGSALGAGGAVTSGGSSGASPFFFLRFFLASDFFLGFWQAPDLVGDASARRRRGPATAPELGARSSQAVGEAPPDASSPTQLASSSARSALTCAASPARACRTWR